MISWNQSAFAEDRRILDNILPAQEIIRNYDKPKGIARCTLKVISMKSFDSVDWRFLLNFMEALVFPIVFIRLIEVCISTPRFSIRLNGISEGFFAAKRGLRQGGPLSPYLFVHGMEILSQLLNKAALEGKIAYHPLCAKQKLIHLSFVDDLMVSLLLKCNLCRGLKM